MADDDETHHCLTKTTSKSSNWAGLHSDLLEPILNRLSYVNVIRFEAVCSPWHSVQQAYISSNPSNTWFPQAPWLMLPPQAEKNGDIRFFHLEEKRVFALYKDDDTLKKELGGNRCLGSTHGWLVHLDQTARFSLFNPFSKTRIKLPALQDFPSIVVDTDVGHGINISLVKRNTRTSYWYSSMTLLQEKFIAKAVLSSDPFHSNNDCRVIVIYGKSLNLAFFKCGEGRWTDLDRNYQFYTDILFCNDHLYALTNKGSVEIWDFLESSPTRIKHIKLSFLGEKREQIGQSLGCVLSSHFYLVEWSGHILLVVRFLDHMGKDWLKNPRTMQFLVYKLDFNEEKWIAVGSLGDGCLFIGENHSLSLSAQDAPHCKENSIYFFDLQLRDSYIYGQLELDVFNLEDRIIKSIHHYNFWRSKPEPKPVWVGPNPW